MRRPAGDSVPQIRLFAMQCYDVATGTGTKVARSTPVIAE